MLKFNKLRPETIYRVKDCFLLPMHSTNSMGRENLITVFSESIEDTGNFFDRKYVRLKYYRKYFVDRKVKFTILGMLQYEINDQADVYYRSIGNKYPTIKLARNPGTIVDMNMIYELGQYMGMINGCDKLERKTPMVKAPIKYDYIVDKLAEISRMFPKHKKKYLLIPVDNYVPFPKNTTMWIKKQELDNHLIGFLRMIEENYQRLSSELSDWNFVFLNMNELFYIECRTANSSTYQTIRALFRKYRSRRGAVVEESSHADLEEDEDSVDDPEDTTTKSKEINNAVAKSTSKLKDLDVSEEEKNKIKSTVISKLVQKKVEPEKEVEDEPKEKVSTVRRNTVSNQVKQDQVKQDTVKDSTIVKSTIKDTVKKTQPIVQEAKSEPTAMSKIMTSRITVPKTTKESENSKPVVEEKPKKNAIKTPVKEVKEKNEPKSKVETRSKVEIDADRELKREILSRVSPNISAARLARIVETQKEIEKVQIDGRSIEEIKAKVEATSIDDNKLKADVINDKIKNIKFNKFEKGYNTKLLEHDLINILMCFSKMDRPLFLISVKKEDVSTVQDSLYRYTAVYEDEKGRRHTLSFDYPKFINDKFIKLNGSEKLLLNQLIPLPVTKVSEDEVQVASDYKKIFIARFGKNVSSKTVKFNKVLPTIDSSIIKLTQGNNLSLNKEYMTSIEYDELSSKYTKIEYLTRDIVIYFNQKEIRDFCMDNDIKIEGPRIPFAIYTDKKGKHELFTLDGHTDTIYAPDGRSTELSPIDFIAAFLERDVPSFNTQFETAGVPKKFMYTRAKIMSKYVPVALLLSFLIGLEPLLNKLKVDWSFNEKRTRTDVKTMNYIQFADGYLAYDSSNFANALILNGLSDIPTKQYNFLDFSMKDVYYDIFNKFYGRRNIGNAFENFNQGFINPVVKEILTDMNLPTNFVDLIIYANSLLENNTCTIDSDMNNMRLRSNEQVNAHLYQVLIAAYEKYRATADNNSPTKFSIKPRELVNSIMDSQVLEEYSTLNPISEIDRMRATSYKGTGGCNSARAFNLTKRAYNDTMMGILAQSSPISGNIGVSRILSLNPNIKSLRGYIDAGSKDKLGNLDETNMMSGAELLVPMTVTRDDPQRVSMASVQSRHTIATVHSDTPLFGYGFDKLLAKTISDKFAYKAKGDGVVSEVNEKLGYMIIKYDDADIEPDVVDITNRQALNTGSGFYINNRLTPCIQAGDQVKEGDVVACNEDFFQYNKLTKDAVYKSGPLARVAVIHGSAVYEDSTVVTEEFAEKMASRVTELKDTTIGKNSNVYYMAKIGQEVKVNDPLMIFDESYEDDYLNKLLSKMAEEEKTDILESSRTKISSKWNGKVIDIKIYYTVPKEEMSESLQKIISSYEKNIKARNKIFEAAGVDRRNLTSLNDITTVTIPVGGKIEGVKMNDNHVLIKFFIQTIDKFSTGDKCTYCTALKGINQTLIPKGQEPYLASDPSIKIDAFMSISGYYSRMTNSFPTTVALNAVLIGAEKKITDILKNTK